MLFRIQQEISTQQSGGKEDPARGQCPGKPKTKAADEPVDPATGPAAHIFGVANKGWGKNDRGTSYVFSEKIVENFVQKHDLDLIVRGHQVMEDGYEFFAG